MRIKFTLILIIICRSLFGQEIILDGYVFESDNRGFLNEVQITALRSSDQSLVGESWSDQDGHFVLKVPMDDYIFHAKKDLFKDVVFTLNDASSSSGSTFFFKVQLNRKPGYLFDITIAEERDSTTGIANAIHNAKIEIYNNTTDKLEFEREAHPSPNFQYTITKGNHYTIMIRKDGFLTKRIEAFVDVEGCILCIEGLDKLNPGVTENLTEGHEMGTLLANIVLQKVEVGKKFIIDNIYYDYGKANLREDDFPALQKLITLLKDNPRLEVELSSHTDSRGKDAANLKLSEKRANTVANYLFTVGNIERSRLRAIGYGESKLVNKCDDGVECSETEHQKNRRTELLVTGIKSLTQLRDKSLLEMKEEEKMDEMLREIMESQEVIEIKEGEELPDELKKQLNKKPKKN